MSIEVRKCTHIKVNGIKCGSPALKISDRCYFHDQAFRRLRISVLQKPPVFPVLEDANSIQVAIMDIMNDLRYDHIDPKLAGKLLYALQIASYNLKRMDLERQDTIQDLPADWHPIEPKNLPRWGYVKLPYDGEPDPTTLPNFKPDSPASDPAQSPAPSERHPERECARTREALGAIESKLSRLAGVEPAGEILSGAKEPPKDLASAVTQPDVDLRLSPTHTPPTSHPDAERSEAEGTLPTPRRKRPSRSSTKDLTPSLPAIEQELARAKAGNADAARKLFELAGLMPRQ